jgi:crotonobetainyl-CoA:carnitine CoA-transferase CaiB-like acyl-CoA transferase
VEITPYLDGVRVLDFTQYLAGPACTRLMAELGATVIKVELPPYGDAARSFAPRLNGRSAFFVQQNRGKQSLCVDIDTAEGFDVLKRLAATVDVVVENFSPGVMARKGLDYETLSAENPGLVMASVSGYGQTGPLAHRSMFDFLAQAYSGLMHMTGDPDGPPTFAGMGLADTNSGVHAFAAIGHALFRKERTGQGSYIDVSMVESLIHMHESAIHMPPLDPGYEPMRQGRHYQMVSPGGTFKGPDGWIVLLCTVNQISNLWTALGRPELAEDERFVSNDGRMANRDDLTLIIEEWMATFDSNDQVLDVLAEHRVPATAVLNPAELGEQEHLRFRGAIKEITDSAIGEMTVPGFPIHYTPSPPPLDLAAPDLGEHNTDVLTKLGLSLAEIDSLTATGVLKTKTRR